MQKKKAGYILSLGIMLGVLMGICGSVFAERGNGEVATDTEALPYEDLRTFTEIFGRIKRDYVEPVSDKKLL
jgi:carboxyl-terminal processing protease